MNRILIFGGTTEGRLLAEFCDKNGINAFVSVATGYGESLLHKSDCINIISGRKNAEEILSFILEKKIAMVVDATHPFAIEASKNIKEACGKAKVKYLRVLRDSEKNACNSGNCYGIYFDSVSPSVSGKDLIKWQSCELPELSPNRLWTVPASVTPYLPRGADTTARAATIRRPIPLTEVMSWTPTTFLPR